MKSWWERSPPTNVAQAQLWPGAVCVEFVVGFSGFPPSTKTNISKFQFDQDGRPAWKPAKADVASSLNIVFYYIHLISFLFTLFRLSVLYIICFCYVL